MIVIYTPFLSSIEFNRMLKIINCFKYSKRFSKIRHIFLPNDGIARTSDPSVKVNSTKSLTASTLLHRLLLFSVEHYLRNVRVMQYKLGPERLTRLGMLR